MTSQNQQDKLCHKLILEFLMHPQPGETSTACELLNNGEQGKMTTW